LELLRELVPKAGTFGFLVNPSSDIAEIQVKEVVEAARTFGQRVHVLNASTAEEIELAFVGIVQRGAGALLMSAALFFQVQRDPSARERLAGPEEAGREAVRAQRIHVEDQAADRRRQGKEVRCPLQPTQQLPSRRQRARDLGRRSGRCAGDRIGAPACRHRAVGRTTPGGGVKPANTDPSQKLARSAAGTQRELRQGEAVLSCLEPDQVKGRADPAAFGDLIAAPCWRSSPLPRLSAGRGSRGRSSHSSTSRSTIDLLLAISLAIIYGAPPYMEPDIGYRLSGCRHRS
jgi:hypothetical protein